MKKQTTLRLYSTRALMQLWGTFCGYSSHYWTFSVMPWVLAPPISSSHLSLIPILRDLLSAIHVNKHIHANVLEPISYSVCYPF